ncbi:MAG: hypothetical protein ACKO37_07455 [Vampirovibrionales bacterium]
MMMGRAGVGAWVGRQATHVRNWVGRQATRVRNTAGGAFNAFRIMPNHIPHDPAGQYVHAMQPLGGRLGNAWRNTSGAVQAMFAQNEHAAQTIAGQVSWKNGVLGRTRDLRTLARTFRNGKLGLERASHVQGRRAALAWTTGAIGLCSTLFVGTTKGIPALQQAQRKNQLETEQQTLVSTTGLKTVRTPQGDTRASVAPDSLEQALATLRQTNDDLAYQNNETAKDTQTLEDKLNSMS